MEQARIPDFNVKRRSRLEIVQHLLLVSCVGLQNARSLFKVDKIMQIRSKMPGCPKGYDI